MTNNFVCNTYKEYIKKAKAPVIDFSKPLCILVDIDGTMLFSDHREWYDNKKAIYDTVNVPLKTILESISRSIKIIFVTGRGESSREVTEKALRINISFYDELIMRPDDNEDKDGDLKVKLYNQFIKDKYSVLFVLEDRPVVIKSLREIGLYVLDCNQMINFKEIF